MSDDILKGTKAEQLLRDPLFVEAFDAVRSDLQRGIETSKFDQGEQREDAYHMLRALQAVKGKIESHVRVGKAAVEKSKLNPFKRVVE